MSKAIYGTTYVFIEFIRGLSLIYELNQKKRIKRIKPESLTVPSTLNEPWSLDFMHDQLSDGRSYRIHNVIDDYNREFGYIG